MKHCVLIGASQIDDLSFIDHIRENSLLIACDRGYEYLLKKNREPDYLIGDFDTLDISHVINPKKTIRLNVIKDDTDIFFAVKTAIDLGYDDFEFHGCLGGKRLEHTLGNIQILSYLKDRKMNGLLYDPDEKTVLFMLREEEYTFHKDAEGFISTFSYDRTTEGLTEKNFKYETDEITLNNSIPLGVSNEFIKGKEGYIKVGKGSLLVVCSKDALKK